MKNPVFKAVRFVFTIYNRHKKIIIKILLLLLIILVSNMALPQITADIVDNGLCAGNNRIVISKSLLLGALHLLISIVYVLSEHYRLIGYNAIQTELKKKSLKKLLTLKISYYSNKSATEVFQQLDEDIKAISGCFSSEILMALIEVFITFGLIPMLIKINWKLTLLMLLAIPIKMIKTIVFTDKGYKIASKLVIRENRYSALISDVISGIHTIRCYGLNSIFYNMFNIRQSDIVRAQYKNDIFQEINIQIENMIADVLTCICYIAAAFFIAGNELTIGEFIAFQTYSLSILNFIGVFLNVGYSFSVLMPSFERFDKFLHEADERVDGELCAPDNYMFEFHKVLR